MLTILQTAPCLHMPVPDWLVSKADSYLNCLDVLSFPLTHNTSFPSCTTNNNTSSLAPLFCIGALVKTKVYYRCGLFLSCPLGPRLRPLYLSFLRRSIALHRASEPAHKQPTIRQEVLRRVMRLPTTLHKVASRPLSSSSPPAQLVKKTHKTHPKNPQDQMKPTKPTLRKKPWTSTT